MIGGHFSGSGVPVMWENWGNYAGIVFWLARICRHRFLTGLKIARLFSVEDTSQTFEPTSRSPLWGTDPVRIVQIELFNDEVCVALVGLDLPPCGGASQDSIEESSF